MIDRALLDSISPQSTIVMKLDLPIRVALLDDHAVVRLGYEREICSDSRLELVGSFGRSIDLLKALREHTIINVLLLDFALSATDSDGEQLITRLRQSASGMRILVASSHDNPATIALVLRAGAHGFLSKSQPMHDVAPAIYQVARGRRYVPEHLVSVVPHVPLSAANPSDNVPTGTSTMSKREQEVMRCILDGMAVNDVAAKFSRSSKTISNQKQSAFKKLGIRTLAELAAFRDRWR